MTSIFHQIIRFVGLDSTHPPAPGCYTVSSTHFRFPAQKLKPQSLSVYSQIFYPSADPSSSSIQRKPYVRPGVIEGLSKWTGVNKAAFALIGASIHPLLPDLDPIPPSQSKDNKNGIESANNNQNNNRSSKEGKFPIVIFSHGLGGNCEIYMNICKDIASHGYIVIALEHADGSGSYAKSIEINQASAESGGVTSGLDITNENEIDVFYKFPPKDMQYEREAVVQFRKPFIDHRIEELRSVFSFIESASDKPKCFQYGDSSFLFLAGHSFGATSTVMATNQDDIVSKIKGAVLFDLWPFPLPRPIVDKGMRVPFISILSETFASGAEVKLTDKLINNSSDVLKLSYYVQGTVHQSFSDGPWFIRSQWLGKKANMIGELDRDVAMNTIVNATCSLFLQSVQASASTSIVDSGADLFTQGKESKFLEVNKYLKPFSFAKIQQELGSKQDKPRM